MAIKWLVVVVFVLTYLQLSQQAMRLGLREMGSFHHRRLITFSTDDFSNTTPEDNIPYYEHDNVYNEESSEEFTTLSSLETFEAAKAAEMKTNKHPFRVASTRYAKIQKCLKDRLNGAPFDYNVYLSCAGCATCEQTTVNVDQENQTESDKLLDEKIKPKEERLKQNLEEQRNVQTQNIEIIDEKSESEKDVKKEKNQIESELERISNSLQRLTEEKHNLTEDIISLQHEKQKKYNKDREYDESHILSSFRHDEKIDLLKFQLKAMAVLNKRNDQYD